MLNQARSLRRTAPQRCQVIALQKSQISIDLSEALDQVQNGWLEQQSGRLAQE